MQKRKTRLTAAVLAGMMLLCGCRREQEVYTAGLRQEVQSETEQDLGRSLQTGTVSADEEQTTASSGICVFVCGAVCEPGVYRMKQGQRIYEAVALAGGFTEEADESWLNQAEPVWDGQKLVVYTKEEVRKMESEGARSEAAASDRKQLSPEASLNGEAAGHTDGIAAQGSFQNAGSVNADGRVNLNSASKEELMTLPGIGEAKASAILAYRSEHGAFSSVEEIKQISGIKTAVFEKIRDKITVG